MQKSKCKNQNGFTLIEALVLLFIFSLITVTFYGVMTVGTRHILISKNRLGAVALANERMEIARNLKYADVGTVGGVVSGNIPAEEEVEASGKKYTVKTLVRYEDDPFDGTLGGNPNDLAYKDYKTVKITVFWNNGSEDQGEVSVVSRFVSPGLEVASAGEGVLSINIFSDQAGGAGVAQATVRITNSDTGVDEEVETDDSGNILLIGIKESIKNYRLTVSKAGYETVITLPPYPDTDYNPTNVHASVIENEINVANIVQNKLSDLVISTKDYSDNIVADVKFDFSGGRILGTQATSPFDKIYNLDVSSQTGSSGQKEYTDISPGEYFFNLSDSEDRYKIIGLNLTSPFNLVADVEQELRVVVADKNSTGLLVRVVTNSEERNPLEGASVKLKNSEESYEETIITESDGRAFFPIAEEPAFEDREYELTIEKDGYADMSLAQNIELGSLAEVEVPMTINP